MYVCACVCELEGCLRLKSFDNCGRNGMPIVTFSLFFIIFFVQTNEAYINVCECTWNYLFIVCIAPCNHSKDNTQLTIYPFDLRRVFMQSKSTFLPLRVLNIF